MTTPSRAYLEMAFQADKCRCEWTKVYAVYVAACENAKLKPLLKPNFTAQCLKFRTADELSKKVQVVPKPTNLVNKPCGAVVNNQAVNNLLKAGNVGVLIDDDMFNFIVNEIPPGKNPRGHQENALLLYMGLVKEALPKLTHPASFEMFKEIGLKAGLEFVTSTQTVANYGKLCNDRRLLYNTAMKAVQYASSSRSMGDRVVEQYVAAKLAEPTKSDRDIAHDKMFTKDEVYSFLEKLDAMHKAKYGAMMASIAGGGS